MPIYHCNIKMISRSSGRSASGAAAYRSASVIKDPDTGLIHDYSKKRDAVFSEILLPDNAPREYADRQTLWNAVQAVETRKDAQLVREVEVALPLEFSREEMIECVRSYGLENFVSVGMIADWALHEKKGNPHAHILLTVRGLDENGKWIAKQKTAFVLDEKGERIPLIDPKTGEQKVRVRKGKGTEKLWVRESIPANDWNDQGNAEKWRAAWAECCNRYLKNEKIDHRSYKRQGIEKEPTIHEGHVTREMGVRSDRYRLNKEIKKRNWLMEGIRKLAAEIKILMQEGVRRKPASEPEQPKSENVTADVPNPLTLNMRNAELEELKEKQQKLKKRMEHAETKELIKREEKDLYGRLERLRKRSGEHPSDEGADGRKRETPDIDREAAERKRNIAERSEQSEQQLVRKGTNDPKAERQSPEEGRGFGKTEKRERESVDIRKDEGRTLGSSDRKPNVLRQNQRGPHL